MPRAAKGARVWLDPTTQLWYIRDGSVKRGTGCRSADREGADKALADYIAEKYEPVRDNRPDVVGVADVLNFYGKTVANQHRSNAAGYAIAALTKWWKGRTVSEIRASTCKEYVAYRTSQGIHGAKSKEALKRTVKGGTARRELAVLQAASTPTTRRPHSRPCLP